MPNTVLGKVSCVPRGDYSASETYYALDIVGHEGGSYLAMKKVTGVTPSNDQVNWMQLSGPGLPGEQGPQGNPGAAAGFGEATATVDDTSGTPSVEVETSGPDTAKVFTFKFYGLKGTKGDTGDKGNTGDTGPTGPQGVSVVTAQINEQGHLIITLSEGEPIDAGDATGPIGPQGIQGEAGESVGSIQRTSGTGAPGTTDTYTMYSTDGSEIGTFTVYNGTNGTGAGDFMADGSVPMTGALDMGGHRVTNVGAPTAGTDAVRQSDLQAVSDEVDNILDGTTPVAIPAATETKVGGIKPGTGLEVEEDGTANVTLTGVPSGGTTGQILTQGASGPEWQDAPDTGVTKFNGRTGEVEPQEGDYTASMVGAIPASEKGAASGVATLDSNGKLAGAQKPTYTASDVGAIASPSGGTTGQVLTKTADGSEWSDAPSGLPDGGTEGQVLTKGESGPEWADNPGMTQAAADARYLQLSGGTMTGALTLNGNPSADNQAANKAYVDSKAPKSVSVTLSASGWASNAQTVTVNGVLADETKQLIQPCPAMASQSAYYSAGIMCTGQAADSLTFTCTAAPAENLTVYVVMQGVSA